MDIRVCKGLYGYKRDCMDIRVCKGLYGYKGL